MAGAVGSSERGIFTFVFTDIEGSTVLAHELGDDWMDVLDHHNRVLRDAFRPYDGIEVRTEGDSFFIAFRDAASAVAACLDGQLAVAGHDFPHGRPLRIRIGMHTGEAVLTEGDFVGFTVHEAARVEAAGHGGQTLLSQSTVDAIGGETPKGSTLRDLGSHGLKDVPEPRRIYQLCHPDLDDVFPPLRSLSATAHNLPAPPSEIVGRDNDLAEVNALLLSDARLVTLTGPGGIGKTRLCLEVAWSLLAYHRGGVWFASLASVTDPDALLDAVASELGIGDVPGQDRLSSLRQHLGGDRALLVLDNLEQVVEGAAQIAELLGACPELKVLATSRERLRLRGEHPVALQPLSTPPVEATTTSELAGSEAVELFNARTSVLDRTFSLTDEVASAVARICSLLEGMPLAIELAASAVVDRGIDAVASGVEQALELLTEGERDLPARQRSLRAAIAWGYDLLEPSEREVFDRLAAFAGSFDLDAAAAIADADTTVIAALVRKSILVERGEGRLAMLEPIRQFALERLDESGSSADVIAHHASWYAGVSSRGYEGLGGAEQRDWVERFALESDNLRAAIDRADGGVALGIAADLGRYWTIRGFLNEGASTLRRTIEGAGPGAEHRPRALMMLGQLERLRGDLDAASSVLTESESLTAASGQDDVRVVVLQQLAELARMRGDHDAALQRLTDALELGRSIGLDAAVARALATMAGVNFERGDVDHAVSQLEEAIAILESIGDAGTSSMVRMNLAAVHLHAGRLDFAAESFAEALAGLDARGDEGGAASCRVNMAVLAKNQGNSGAARELLAHAIEVFERTGERRMEYTARWTLLQVERGEDGDRSAALRQLRRCYELALDLGEADAADVVLETWAGLSVESGDQADAARRYQRFIENRIARGDEEGAARGRAALDALSVSSS